MRIPGLWLFVLTCFGYPPWCSALIDHFGEHPEDRHVFSCLNPDNPRLADYDGYYSQDARLLPEGSLCIRDKILDGADLVSAFLDDTEPAFIPMKEYDLTPGKPSPLWISLLLAGLYGSQNLLGISVKNALPYFWPDGGHDEPRYPPQQPPKSDKSGSGKTTSFSDYIDAPEPLAPRSPEQQLTPPNWLITGDDKHPWQLQQITGVQGRVEPSAATTESGNITRLPSAFEAALSRVLSRLLRAYSATGTEPLTAQQVEYLSRELIKSLVRLYRDRREQARETHGSPDQRSIANDRFMVLRANIGELRTAFVLLPEQQNPNHDQERETLLYEQLIQLLDDYLPPESSQAPVTASMRAIYGAGFEAPMIPVIAINNPDNPEQSPQFLPLSARHLADYFSTHIHQGGTIQWAQADSVADSVQDPLQPGDMVEDSQLTPDLSLIHGASQQPYTTGVFWNNQTSTGLPDTVPGNQRPGSSKRQAEGKPEEQRGSKRTAPGQTATSTPAKQLKQTSDEVGDGDGSKGHKIQCTSCGFPLDQMTQNSSLICTNCRMLGMETSASSPEPQPPTQDEDKDDPEWAAQKEKILACIERGDLVLRNIINLEQEDFDWNCTHPDPKPVSTIQKGFGINIFTEGVEITIGLTIEHKDVLFYFKKDSIRVKDTDGKSNTIPFLPDQDSFNNKKEENSYRFRWETYYPATSGHLCDDGYFTTPKRKREYEDQFYTESTKLLLSSYKKEQILCLAISDTVFFKRLDQWRGVWRALTEKIGTGLDLPVLVFSELKGEFTLFNGHIIGNDELFKHIAHIKQSLPLTKLELDHFSKIYFKAFRHNPGACLTRFLAIDPAALKIGSALLESNIMDLLDAENFDLIKLKKYINEYLAQGNNIPPDLINYDDFSHRITKKLKSLCPDCKNNKPQHQPSKLTLFFRVMLEYGLIYEASYFHFPPCLFNPVIATKHFTFTADELMELVLKNDATDALTCLMDDYSTSILLNLDKEEREKTFLGFMDNVFLYTNRCEKDKKTSFFSQIPQRILWLFYIHGINPFRMEAALKTILIKRHSSERFFYDEFNPHENHNSEDYDISPSEVYVLIINDFITRNSSCLLSTESFQEGYETRIQQALEIIEKYRTTRKIHWPNKGVDWDQHDKDFIVQQWQEMVEDARARLEAFCGMEEEPARPCKQPVSESKPRPLPAQQNLSNILKPLFDPSDSPLIFSDIKDDNSTVREILERYYRRPGTDNISEVLNHPELIAMPRSYGGSHHVLRKIIIAHWFMEFLEKEGFAALSATEKQLLAVNVMYQDVVPSGGHKNRKSIMAAEYFKRDFETSFRGSGDDNPLNDIARTLKMKEYDTRNNRLTEDQNKRREDEERMLTEKQLIYLRVVRFTAQMGFLLSNWVDRDFPDFSDSLQNRQNSPAFNTNLLNLPWEELNKQQTAAFKQGLTAAMHGTADLAYVSGGVPKYDNRAEPYAKRYQLAVDAKHGKKVRAAFELTPEPVQRMEDYVNDNVRRWIARRAGIHTCNPQQHSCLANTKTGFMWGIHSTFNDLRQVQVPASMSLLEKMQCEYDHSLLSQETMDAVNKEVTRLKSQGIAMSLGTLTQKTLASEPAVQQLNKRGVTVDSRSFHMGNEANMERLYYPVAAQHTTSPRDKDPEGD